MLTYILYLAPFSSYRAVFVKLSPVTLPLVNAFVLGNLFEHRH